MSGPFEIVDAQIGVWEADNDRYPWDPARKPAGGGIDGRVHDHKLHKTNSIVQTLAHMDAVGVHAAVLSHSSQYGEDLSYVLDAARRFPERFASMPRISHEAPDLQERIAAWREQPGALGIRVVFLNDRNVADLRAGRYDPLFAAAERHEVPLMVFCPRILPDVGAVARRYPHLQLVLDHLGLPQPPLMEADPEPFHALPELLALAELPNVAVKFSGAPTLSREPYPFRDLWPHLSRVVQAFRPDRLMWAADYPRVDDHTYAEALSFVLHTDELGASDKERILGATARAVLRWPRTPEVVA